MMFDAKDFDELVRGKILHRDYNNHQIEIGISDNVGMSEIEEIVNKAVGDFEMCIW